MDTDGRVLRFDSLSKTVSSGLRVGWATGPKPLIDRIGNYGLLDENLIMIGSHSLTHSIPFEVLHAQSTLLHTSGVSQMIVKCLLDEWKGVQGFEEHVTSVTAFYKEKRDVFLTSAEKWLGGGSGDDDGNAVAEWNVPSAGN